MALAKGFNAVESAAEAAVRDIVESHGFSLWDVVFVKEGAGWYLRVLIDKKGGVSIDDCESIDGLINDVIDRQDFIDRVDYLEIGSAEKTVKCTLDGFDGERITVSGDFGSVCLAVSEVSGINYDDFDDYDELD